MDIQKLSEETGCNLQAALGRLNGMEALYGRLLKIHRRSYLSGTQRSGKGRGSESNRDKSAYAEGNRGESWIRFFKRKES